MDDQAYPETVTILVSALVEALTELGLSAESFGGRMVWVANRAADPPPGANPHVARLSPGMRQVIQCCPDFLGHLGWFWVWSSPGEMPTYEWFAPGVQIGEAAGKVAQVLAVRSETAS